MFTPIVVPSDGSPESEHAFPFAVALARLCRAPLELVHVDVPTPKFGTAPAFDRQFDIEKARTALTALRATADQLNRTHGVTVTAVQRRGQIVPALGAYLDRRRDALVVMTSHGRGGFSRAWLGSVADALIRHIPQPVLVIPAVERTRSFARDASLFRRILVPLDGSKFSNFALDVARALAFSRDVEMHLVHVLEPWPLQEPFPDLASALERERVQSAESDRRIAAENELERIGRTLDRPAGTVRAHAEISVRAAAALLAYVRANDIDLIAIATHGRSGIERAVLGSVADKILRGAEVPVVVAGRRVKRKRQTREVR